MTVPQSSSRQHDLLPSVDPEHLEPLLNKESSRQNGSSATQAFFNLAKASIGAGSFALPWAIAQAGVLLGAGSLIVISLVSLYTMRLLVDTKRRVNAANNGGEREAESLAEVAQKIAPGWGFALVQFFVIVCNTGVAAGYLIFIGLNLRAACLSLFGLNWRLLDYYFLILPIVVVMTFLPSFKQLAKAAYLGSIFLIFAMVFTYISGAQNGNFLPLGTYTLFNIDTFFRFFGIALFLFGVHTMVIPLEQTLANPSEIKGVLNWGCSTVLITNLPFAVFGYLAFGNGVSAYVFCSLPHNTLLSFLQLSLSLELMLSVPIVVLPANMAIEECLKMEEPHDNRGYLKRCAVRALLILGAWAFAVAVPVFQSVLSLVGGFACAAIAFVIPPLFDIKVRFDTGESKSISVKDVVHAFIFLFGLAALGITTVMNIQDISKMFASGQVHPVYENVSDGGSC